MSRAGPSLYEMLLGHIDDEPIDGHDPNTLEILSVLSNVRRILNTRAGSIKHIPDFGLPDLSGIYRALPASAHLLKRQIEETLLVYEPRITGVDLTVAVNDESGLLLSYLMTCRLKKSGLVRFGTHFEASGRIAMHWQR